MENKITAGKKQINYNDPSAARFVENIKGWVDINNRFFGDNKDSEHMARYSSCTHRKCECGEIMSKGYTICEKCRAKKELERYNVLPFKAWDYKEPVYSYYADQYFFSTDDLIDYLEDNEVDSRDLRLVICEPSYFSELDYDQWEDIMPENSDEFPEQLQKAVEAFNEAISKLPPASYYPGKIRTEY